MEQQMHQRELRPRERNTEVEGGGACFLLGCRVTVMLLRTLYHVFSPTGHPLVPPSRQADARSGNTH